MLQFSQLNLRVSVMQQRFSTSTGFLGKLLPFFAMGIFLILGIVSLILVSYLLFLGCLIGFILFAIAWVKNRFFTKKHDPNPLQQGRIYDHDDK